jgi:O-antigen biosynthesis protein
MAETGTDMQRVSIDGKFFRLGEKKFYVKGVTYGPFAPNAAGEPYPEKDRATADFEQITSLGSNVLRVYHVPPAWLLDLANDRGLKFLIDVPWWQTGCFLDTEKTQEEARATVRDAVKSCGNHPAVFAFSVANEIPPDVVRWHGKVETGRFLDELVDVAKTVNPQCLVTFGNFPPTEYLSASRIDFVMFNVYLHQQKSFERYLSHLQMIADTRPLLLGEIGIDSQSEGDEAKAEILSWQIESAFRGGLAGVCVFSFTDDWHKDDGAVLDWSFGLVDRKRVPKLAYGAVMDAFCIAPYFKLASAPKVSVVVATYNGSRTLKKCLQSLERLNYPDYEVIVVDDGSTDTVPEVAKAFPYARYIHQPNLGLSVARNTGIQASTGEIVAFTDDDCRADEDWLHYLVGDLASGDFKAMGGHNFLPPDDSPTAAVVMASPGGPVHVMLTEREAEHIPGCNMAFYKSVLEEIGGFDPIFKKAGDDVDICWRLQQAGHRIGFNSSGFVWHYRRASVGAYLRQQSGYGEAEALLMRRHPDYFNAWGGGHWRGRIYSPLGTSSAAETIYRGRFGEGMFQSIYATSVNWTLARFTSPEQQLLVTLPLLLSGYVLNQNLLIAAGFGCIAIWFWACGLAGWHSKLPPAKVRSWSRPLVALMYFLQPIVRSWSRHTERFIWRQSALTKRETLDSQALRGKSGEFDLALYWTEKPVARSEFLEAVLSRLEHDDWVSHSDSGWGDYDIEILGSRWCRLRLRTVVEWHRGGGELIKCRLHTEWSVLGKLLFGVSLLFAVLVAAGITTLSLWHLLFATPFAVLYWIDRQKRSLRRIFSVTLDEEARKQGFKRIYTAGKSDSTKKPLPPETKPKSAPEKNEKSTPESAPV